MPVSGGANCWLICAQVAVYVYHYDHWFFSEPTLTLPNLNTLLDSVSEDWYNMGVWMDIPPSKRNMIKEQHSSKLQCSRESGQIYLTYHPSPMWLQVTTALYHLGHIEELQVVQRNYLKGKWAGDCITPYWCMQKNKGTWSCVWHRGIGAPFHTWRVTSILAILAHLGPCKHVCWNDCCYMIVRSSCLSITLLSVIVPKTNMHARATPSLFHPLHHASDEFTKLTYFSACIIEKLRRAGVWG